MSHRVIDVAPDRRTAQTRMVLISTHILNAEGTAFTTVGAHYEIGLIRVGEEWQILQNRIFPAWRSATEAGTVRADAPLS